MEKTKNGWVMRKTKSRGVSCPSASDSHIKWARAAMKKQCTYSKPQAIAYPKWERSIRERLSRLVDPISDSGKAGICGLPFMKQTDGKAD